MRLHIYLFTYLYFACQNVNYIITFDIAWMLYEITIIINKRAYVYI